MQTKKDLIETQDAGARILLKMDALIQGWTKKMNDLAEAEIKKKPKRVPMQPDFSCEIKSGALPVSIGLKAVHFGTLKIAFRVLPRAAEQILEDEVIKMASKLGAKIAVRQLFGFVPLVGSLISVAVGFFQSKKFFDQLEAMEHAVLGCKPDALDANPMRFALNEIMQEVKLKGMRESRPVMKVRTRHGGTTIKKGGGDGSGGGYF